MILGGASYYSLKRYRQISKLEAGNRGLGVDLDEDFAAGGDDWGEGDYYGEQW